MKQEKGLLRFLCHIRENTFSSSWDASWRQDYTQNVMTWFSRSIFFLGISFHDLLELRCDKNTMLLILQWPDIFITKSNNMGIHETLFLLKFYTMEVCTLIWKWELKVLYEQALFLHTFSITKWFYDHFRNLLNLLRNSIFLRCRIEFSFQPDDTE